MRVFVDLRCLQDPDYSFRGVGLHTACILRHAPRPCELIGVLDETLPKLPAEYAALLDRVQHAVSPRPSDRPTVFLQPSPMTHIPDALAPLLGRPAILSCAIVYDFIPLDEPRYLPNAESRRRYLSSLYWLKAHQLFYPISRCSASRLNSLIEPPPDSVQVTGASVRRVFASFNPSQIQNVRHASRFAPGHYFFLLGGNEERKNADLAVAAHARFTAKSAGSPGLVLGGRYSDAFRQRLLGLYKQNGGDPHDVEFTERLTDEELAALYHRSLATLCPSHSEGFSLPVVEAMACGSPVLASSIEAHRDLVLQPEALFPADDPAVAATLLERVANDPAFRARLAAEQAPVASRFHEEEVGGRLWGHVCRRLNARRAPRYLSSRSGKPRLAVLSPYPPDHTGVADYTAQSLESLARHATVDVYTDAPSPRPDPWVNRFHPISAAAYLHDEYDRVLAVLGNSDFHLSILDLHNRYGGPCLMHDNRLADLYVCRHGAAGFAERAGRLLGRTVRIQEVRDWLENPGQLPTLFFDEILSKADPLLVHSRIVQADVQRRYQTQSAYLPFCCRSPFREEDLAPPSRQAARQRLGVPAGQILIVSLGVVDPGKRPFDCLWALEFLREWGIAAQFHFVGDSRACKVELQQLAEQLGLVQQIRLLDSWVSAQTYRDYLLAADFAVQLRGHGFNGTSAAVLDCITAGLPTVTTQRLAATMEAPDYLFPVPDCVSAVLVAEQLANAHAAGRCHIRSCSSRTDYLREHSFDRYAVELLKILEMAA